MESERSEDISFNKEELKRRKEALMEKLKLNKNSIAYILLAIIAIIGYNIRTKNLPLLQDKIPLALDPHVFLRYAQYLLEHGKLMAVDMMRYYPTGYPDLNEFNLLSHFLVYLYKFLHFFVPSMTLEKAVILYPPIMFVVGLVFFFLLLRKLFDWKVAIVSSAFLIVIPAYLYRTMAGFSDKESFAMAVFFMAFYFLIIAWKEKSIKKAILYAGIAGFINGIMGLVWGGVSFTFLIVGAFALIQVILNKLNKQNFYVYITWFIVLIFTLNRGYPERFTMANLLTSFTTLIIVFSFVLFITHYLLIKKDYLKLKDKIKIIPTSIFSLILPIILGVIGILIIIGPSFFIAHAKEFYISLVEPFGTTRWALTVAESHQPYFTDWIGQFDWKYLALMFVGATILFFEAIKQLNKRTIQLSGAFLVFILLFSMSRYSQSSTFNGVTSISKFTYIGSLIGFFALIIYLYFYIFYNDKDTFKKLKDIKEEYIFVLLWFIILIVAARSAIRLLFLFAPITAVMVGYATIKLVDYTKKYVKQDILKIIAYILIIFVVGTLLLGHYKSVDVQAQYTGPSFNSQWQQAMSWVQENTAENAVFAHWWDYGYWVQTGGNRATLSDGGNAVGGINHFIGRHVLTGHSEREALEYLKAKNATHLLIISDEIGKYPAFSSIGADKDYDRYSWIPTFGMDPNQIMETRNATIYLFTGGTAVDHDIIYNDMLFPANVAGIGGFFIKVNNIEVDGPNNTKQVVQQFDIPEMALFYNGQQIRVPVNCIYFNNQKIIFDEPNAIKACLRIIPDIQPSGQVNPMASLLYLSPEVSQTNLARLFLMNEESEYFKLVYTDEDKGMPLASYSGRQIGPLKIWEITYPDDLEIPQEYYGFVIPEEVTKVRK